MRATHDTPYAAGVPGTSQVRLEHDLGPGDESCRVCCRSTPHGGEAGAAALKIKSRLYARCDPGAAKAAGEIDLEASAAGEGDAAGPERSSFPA